MENINHIAVFACAFLSLVVGGLWYSPWLFAKSWQTAAGFSDEDLKKFNPAKNFGLSFLLAYLISYNLAFFLAGGTTDWKWGLTAGILASIWAIAAYLIVSLFEMRSFKHVLINSGYMFVYFALAGLILGAWR